VVCNCAAIPDTLVESELFGHVRGSFTGATQDKPGLFEAAHGGSLLLDEIAEMPLAAQAKLLRAVQQQEVQRVGAIAVRKVNVRVIAATHRDLRAMVAERTFREDLFFRIGMVELRLPSLSARKEDVPMLLKHFLARFAEMYGKPIQGFTRKAEMALTAYNWPGNVRELEGVVGSAAMMANPPLLDVSDLPPEIAQPSRGASPGDGDPLVSLDDIQVIHAHRVLARLGGDKVRAAEVLGVSRATLYRLLAKTPEA
jgi:transcriptional regulator with PAS, ATPase and Fis domain